MPPSSDTLARMNHLEVVLKEQNKLLKTLASNFAWYHYNERVRCFAVIQKLQGDTAELVAFSSTWSSGSWIIEKSQLFIFDPDKPADEQPKSGKWEPILSLSEVLRDFDKEIREEFEQSEEPENPETAKVTENPAKGRLIQSRK